MLGKMAIVGNGDEILVFKASGVDTFPAEDDKKAKEVLRKIAKEYEIIFVTEDLAKALGEFLKRFDEEPYPLVATIPSTRGENYGVERLKNAMERALGVDILFQK